MNNINNLEKQFSFWVKILRMKASEYEHTARKNGDVVSSPSLDDICIEMWTFKNGFSAGEYKKRGVDTE